MSAVPVLWVALVAALVAALHLHDTSATWETQAATATRERDRLTDQLADAETRIAHLEDILDRTERARWETRGELAKSDGRVREAMDACTTALGSAVSILVGDAGWDRARRHVQEADAACSDASVLHEDLAESLR